MAILVGGVVVIKNGLTVLRYAWVYAAGSPVERALARSLVPMVILAAIWAVTGGLFVLRGSQLRRLREAGRRGLEIASLWMIVLVGASPLLGFIDASAEAWDVLEPHLALGIAVATVPFLAVVVMLRSPAIREITRDRQGEGRLEGSGSLPPS